MNIENSNTQSALHKVFFQMDTNINKRFRSCSQKNRRYNKSLHYIVDWLNVDNNSPMFGSNEQTNEKKEGYVYYCK
jgi:hypothetical protein